MKACGFGWSSCSRLERVCSALRGPSSPKKRVAGTQSSSPAGGDSEDDEGLQSITARGGPKPRRSMMEMWLDSFTCSSYCKAGLTGSSACQPQSIMGSPASDAEVGDGLRGELPAR